MYIVTSLYSIFNLYVAMDIDVVKTVQNHVYNSIQCDWSEVLAVCVLPQMKWAQICIRPFVNVVLSHILLALQNMTIDLFSSAVHSHWSLLNYDECLPGKVKLGQKGPRCFHLSHFYCNITKTYLFSHDTMGECNALIHTVFNISHTSH